MKQIGSHNDVHTLADLVLKETSSGRDSRYMLREKLNQKKFLIPKLKQILANEIKAQKSIVTLCSD